MIASALGLGVQVSASALLFTAVKIIGAACLVWFGRFAAALPATRLHWRKRAFGGMILFGIPVLFKHRASSATA
ncbi:hypothetical protein [Sagittula sp. P11]|uniref:hypothetical protein n=1 Tax=Sagittula sp. P11 TaxID=2009329 RepID=UPI0018E2902A|nr:hypothetical protein [Sagittula sp. P11]